MLNALYLLIIVLYLLSVLGYFIDFIQTSQKVNRIAFWLLSIVWFLQFFFFVLRMFEYNRLPLMTIFEGLFLYAWILVTFSLIINRLFKMDFLIFFVNVVGFVIMTISVFAPTGDAPEQLQNLLVMELLVIHVSVILLSYGAFTLSFAFSFMYMLQHFMLKGKQWGKRMYRIGDLAKLERFSYVFALVGFPLLVVGLILGVIWAWIEFGTVPWFDLKVVSSFVVIAVYGWYLFEHVVNKKRGYSLALLNMAAFLVLLINYFLSSSFSEFHLWY
ncbi:cytochrome C assembly family protein [Alteribacter natronophilus]|uniref:cytochrome C assembly family protein n=1 Tax=Alteribacter natronophilus TaxID=2583810 RepID=UPI00110DEFFF|nr:cytochrome c biogenesis protein CcsA [Alteribacter natronophilus]TMW71613.1 cytochrome C assembly protein [Alteribacter natronophilus]